MFQPQDPNIFQLGNRRTENLVSRGGGRIWNPTTNQWDKFWSEESYRSPYGVTLTHNPVVPDWFQLVNSGMAFMIDKDEMRKLQAGDQGGEQEQGLRQTRNQVQKQIDFMSMFGPYITGEHLRS